MPEVRRKRSRYRGALGHRLSRLRQNRPVVLVGAGLLGGLLLLLLWCGWTAWSVAGDLDEVEQSANLLRAELVDGDADGARDALAAYQDAAEAAESSTDGSAWWVLEQVPVFGDDAEGVHTVSGVLADLGRDALPPLVDAADQVTARAFQPADHRFPLAAITEIREPARVSEEAFADADATLSEVDSGSFAGPMRERFDRLRDVVLDARATLGSAYRAADLMPTLLGADGPRDYLLVLQNNAELRSTGGLPGSISVVHAEDGHVEIVEQEAAANLRPREQPLRLDEEERTVFSNDLGRFFLDANLTPDVPRVAELMRARWEEVTGVRIDGIFLVDPVAVSYLLDSTGEVAVPGFPPVAAGDVVASVENGIYVSTVDRDVHDDYQNAVAEAVFDVFADGGGDPATMIRNLATATSEGRIRMHSFDREVQDRIAGTAIAGELPTEATGSPSVGVYVNDSTESKMSYYLRYDVDLVARSCTGGVQDLVGTFTITNDTPESPETLPVSVTGVHEEDSRIEPGHQFVLVYLVSPIDGTLRDLEIDGRGLPDPVVREFRHRTVAALGLYLEPEQTQAVDFVLRTGPEQTGDIGLTVTPNAHPGSESATVRSACR